MYTTQTTIQVLDSQGNPVDVNAIIQLIQDADRQIAQMQKMRDAQASILTAIQTDVPQALPLEAATLLSQSGLVTK